MLSENKRVELDTIVGDMLNNKESDFNIQFVVDDFKTKYDVVEPVIQEPTIKEQLGERAVESLKAGERFQKGEQGIGETILQTGGQIAGGFTDIIAKGFSAILPDFIEEPLKEGVGKIAETETVQKALLAYQNWAEKNPVVAKDLEAALNIAALYPSAKAAQSVLKTGAKVAEAVTTGVGKVTAATGKKLFETTFDITAKEAPLLQAYKAKVPFWERINAAIQGTTPKGKPVLTSETALRQGLSGTEGAIGVQAKQATTNLWNKVIDPALSQVKEKVSIKEFFGNVEKTIRKITADAARRTDLLEALQVLKDDYKNITQVSFSRLQKIKEDWARFVPEKA